MAVRTGQTQSSQEDFVFAEYPSAILALAGEPIYVAYMLPLFRKDYIEIGSRSGPRLVFEKYLKDTYTR